VVTVGAADYAVANFLEKRRPGRRSHAGNGESLPAPINVIPFEGIWAFVIPTVATTKSSLHVA
jgi:hypothetical protein